MINKENRIRGFLLVYCKSVLLKIYFLNLKSNKQWEIYCT